MIDLVGQFQEGQEEDQVVAVDSFHLGVLVEGEDPLFQEDLVEVADSYCLEDLGVVAYSYRLEDQVEEASLKMLE